MQSYESQLNGDLNWAHVKGTHVFGLPCQLESYLDSWDVLPQFCVLDLQRRLLQVWLILLLSILKPISKVRESYLARWKDAQQALKDEY